MLLSKEQLAVQGRPRDDTAFTEFVVRELPARAALKGLPSISGMLTWAFAEAVKHSFLPRDSCLQILVMSGF